jgi:AcrR family transcriptional regulator
MVSSRRIGAETSETRALLVEAAEQLMRAEGYAAVTSRRLAAFAGLKPQLVHYYFRTMDELFEAVFKRAAEQYLGYLLAVKDKPDALSRIWRIGCTRDVAVLTVEFLALGNRHEAVRQLIRHYSEEYKKIQMQIIERTMRDRKLDTERWPPAVLAVVLETLPNILGISGDLSGMSEHRAAQEFIGKLIGGFEAALT